MSQQYQSTGSTSPHAHSPPGSLFTGCKSTPPTHWDSTTPYGMLQQRHTQIVYTVWKTQTHTHTPKTTYCTTFNSHMARLEHALQTTPTANTPNNPFTPRHYGAAETHTHTELTTALFWPLFQIMMGHWRGSFRKELKTLEQTNSAAAY